jgi:hypothetical protein
MPPHISTWTQSQAIGFSVLFGLLGAAVVVGVLYLLAGIANRPRRKQEPRPSSRIEPDRPWSRVLVTNVKGCARCGGDHPRRLLLAFTRPPADATHYTICPTTEEPILVLVSQAPAKEPVSITEEAAREYGADVDGMEPDPLTHTRTAP